jgi:hypothetical protein
MIKYLICLFQVADSLKANEIHNNPVPLPLRVTELLAGEDHGYAHSSQQTHESEFGALFLEVHAVGLEPGLRSIGIRQKQIWTQVQSLSSKYRGPRFIHIRGKFKTVKEMLSMQFIQSESR